MTSGAKYRELASMRLAEAETLYKAEHFSGAYYLCGYAVECALKSIIAKQFVADSIPDKNLVNNAYTHDLNKLVSLAGLAAALQEAQQKPDFQANWAVAVQWTERSRYETIDKASSGELIAAVTDSSSGVFPWLLQNLTP